MAGRVSLEASTKDLNIAPGERNVITVTVTNTGYVVDAFDMSVRNLDTSWYTLNPARVSLFPKAAAVVTLQVHPPAGSQALAGDYAFELVATSRDTPEEFSSLPMRIWLAAAGDIALAIEPQRIVAREGQFRLSIDNNGNSDRPLVLRPSDPDELLRFRFGNPLFFPLASAKPKAGPDDTTAAYNVATARAAGELDAIEPPAAPEWAAPGPESGQGYLSLTIPAGTRLEIPLHVERKDREWFGQNITHRVDVAVTPPGVEWEEKEARRTSAELVYPPTFAWASAVPTNVLRLLLILLPLLLFLLLLFLVLRPQGNNQAGLSAADRTATARAAGGNGLSSADLTATAQAGGGGGLSSADQTATAQAGGLSSADRTATAQALANEPSGPPRIVRFDWSENEGAVQANWEVTPTQRLTVTINGTPVAASGSQPVDVNEDRSLTLVATNSKGEASRSIGVALLRPPTIRAFTADQTDVAAGTEVTLTWDTQRADRVTLDGSPVDGPTGSIRVTPSTTTEYLLTAENAFGQVISRVTVTVR